MFKRKEKYNRSPKDARTIAGVTFDSKAEMKRWLVLSDLLEKGEIKNLQRQIKYPLILPDGTPIKIGNRQSSYIADFVYDENGQQVIEDVKGFFTPAAKIKIAVFEAIYKVKVRITK